MAISRAASNAAAALQAAKDEALRKRAARQAARTLTNPEEIPVVECVVLPMGDGKISMGHHVGGLGEAHYDEGEKPSFQLPVAIALYDRGYVNFEGAREASAEARKARAAAAAEARAAAAAAEAEASEG